MLWFLFPALISSHKTINCIVVKRKSSIKISASADVYYAILEIGLKLCNEFCSGNMV